VSLAALLEQQAAATERFSARVVGIANGDTITVLERRREVKVRLHGIDCPEGSQPWGKRAKQFASGLAFGRVVRIEVMDTDRYGRTVAKVYLPDGASLGERLVQAGMAWWFRRYAPDSHRLERLENEARKSRRGLWSDRNPVAPWDYRGRGSAPLAQPSLRLKSAVAAAVGAGSSRREIVFTTGGAKYHREGCRHLRRSRRQTTRRDTERRGLSPCGVCRP
jgi:micrococcal nuclease